MSRRGAPSRPGHPGRLDRLDAFQQRHRGTAVAAATAAKWNEDGAGRLGSLVAYAAFLSVFPLLLVLLTVTEIVLHSHPTLRNDVVDAALRQFPGIGSELKANTNGLTESNVAFAAMVFVWLVYGCLRLSRNAQVLMARVWDVPRDELPSYGRWLPRALGFLVVLGVGFVLGGALAGIGSFGGLGPVSPLVGFVASLAVNVAMFWTGFVIVGSEPDPWRSYWRGALLAGFGWTVLQLGSTLLLAHELRHYRALYGAFATFIVLLWWIGLGTQLTAFAVELDVVVRRRLWPRSFRREDTAPPSPAGPDAQASIAAGTDPGSGAASNAGAGRGEGMTNPSSPPRTTAAEATRKPRE